MCVTRELSLVTFFASPPEALFFAFGLALALFFGAFFFFAATGGYAFFFRRRRSSALNLERREDFLVCFFL